MFSVMRSFSSEQRGALGAYQTLSLYSSSPFAAHSEEFHFNFPPRGAPFPFPQIATKDIMHIHRARFFDLVISVILWENTCDLQQLAPKRKRANIINDIYSDS